MKKQKIIEACDKIMNSLNQIDEGMFRNGQATKEQHFLNLFVGTWVKPPLDFIKEEMTK